MTTQNNQQIYPKPKSLKFFWISLGIFIILLGYNLFVALTNKDERLCIYEIPASVKWEYKNSDNITTSLIERNINLWRYEVALKEYGLKYLSEGADSSLNNLTIFDINYCNLDERRNITIPFKKYPM